MKKVFFRTFAYLIDVLLLGLILTLVVSTIPFFNDKKIGKHVILKADGNVISIKY